MAKTKAGDDNCPVCENRIVWRLADSGSLSCFCQDCDFQGYAKEGTEAKRVLMKKIGAPGNQQSTPAATPAAPEPKPEKKSAFGVFGL